MKESKINTTFKELRSRGKKAFIPYIMAGDPSLKTTQELILLLEEWGADIIELGVPFTDPLADGPTIQRAAERALTKKVTLKKVIKTVGNVRNKTDIPIVLMTYLNPVFKYGIDEFINDSTKAGVDGVIIPDLPPDEEKEFIGDSKKGGIDTIFLLAPTSTDERIKLVAKVSSGFIYYVSITGITGSKILFNKNLKNMIKKIRGFSDKPVAVGFGVKTPEEAREASRLADGVVVGTSIVKIVSERGTNIEKYIKSLRKAI